MFNIASHVMQMNPYQVGKTISPQKTPVLKRAADKKKRTMTPMKMQFMVSLVEKSLPINLKPEAVTTTATATPTLMVKPIATAAKLNPIPLTVFNLSRPKVQESPSLTVKTFPGKGGPSHSPPTTIIPQ